MGYRIQASRSINAGTEHIAVSTYRELLILTYGCKVAAAAGHSGFQAS
jgi:hypothetical protein